MNSRHNGGVSWLRGLAICLPCLIPILVIALLVGGGVGAVGSFLSDHALLVAAIAAAVTLFALATGMIVRWAMYDTTGIRFLAKKEETR